MYYLIFFILHLRRFLLRFRVIEFTKSVFVDILGGIIN